MNPTGPETRQPEHNSSATTSSTSEQQPNALQLLQNQTKKLQETENIISTLTVELPSTTRQELDDDDDEPTTPRSLESKISIPTTCPPAPRKPKTVSMSHHKRKTPSFNLISVDLMVKINAMFAHHPVEVVVVPDILAGDLDAAGDRVKKVKKADGL